MYLPAAGTAVDYDVSLFGVKLDADRLHQPLAFVSPVAGVHVKVLGPKTKRTVISGAVAERLHLGPAILTDK